MNATTRALNLDTPRAGHLNIGSPRPPSDFVAHRNLVFSRVTVIHTTGGHQLSVSSFASTHESSFECAIGDLVSELGKRGHEPQFADWKNDLAALGEADLGDGWQAILGAK